MKLKKVSKPGYILTNAFLTFPLEGRQRRFRCTADWKPSLSNYLSGDTSIWNKASDKNDPCYLFDNLEYGLSWCRIKIKDLHQVKAHLYPIRDSRADKCTTPDGAMFLKYEDPERRMYGTLIVHTSERLFTHPKLHTKETYLLTFEEDTNETN